MAERRPGRGAGGAAEGDVSAAPQIPLETIDLGDGPKARGPRLYSVSYGIGAPVRSTLLRLNETFLRKQNGH